VKRWLLLTAAGVLMLGLGLALLRRGEPLDILKPAIAAVRWAGSRWHPLLETDWLPISLGLGLLLGGMMLVAYSLWRATASLSGGHIRRRSVTDWVGSVVRSRQLAQGPRVAVIGGGTGLSTMLRGLKQYTNNIVAIVTVTDDGGSSGKLQRQLNIPPPGDIRNCIAALADEESVMTELLQFRFRGPGTGEGLRDHAVGNLVIAALTAISDGDFQAAVRKAGRVLNIRGEVIPSTIERVALRGEMEDGTMIDGETAIAHARKRIKRIHLVPGDASAPPEVLEAIRLADIVVIGPGSVFTSIIPNLLVQGVAEALAATRALRVYVCNVMTQPGETDGFSASQHVKAIEAHVPRPVFDRVLVNTDVPRRELLEKYRQTGSVLVEPDCDKLRSLGYRPVPGSFVSETDVVRHDPTKLAAAIMRMLN
jgi:uncharacterized cofD-like protein